MKMHQLYFVMLIQCILEENLDRRADHYFSETKRVVKENHDRKTSVMRGDKSVYYMLWYMKYHQSKQGIFHFRSLILEENTDLKNCILTSRILTFLVCACRTGPSISI